MVAHLCTQAHGLTSRRECGILFRGERPWRADGFASAPTTKPKKVMSKKDRPYFKCGDKIVPLVSRVKALNDKLVVTPDDTPLTVTDKPRFDRKLHEWVLCVKRGIRFLARLFFNMTRAVKQCASRRRKKQVKLRWEYAH